MEFNTELITAISANSGGIGVAVWWLKSYIEKKSEKVDKVTDRVSILENRVDFKEEKLTGLTEKIEILVDNINQTNLKMMELQTLMEVYLKRKN